MYVMEMTSSALPIPQSHIYCVVLCVVVDVAFGKWLKLGRIIWMFFAFSLKIL